MEKQQNQIETPEQKNQEKFDKAFWKEIQDPSFDQKTFNEMVKWANYDESKTKEENAKNAFNWKVEELISKNLNNLPAEQQKELKDLQKQAQEWKDVKELLVAFNEINQEFSNRAWESAKSSQDLADKQAKENTDKENKTWKEYLDKLKEGIRQNQEIADKKAQELEKQKQEIAEATKIQQWPEADAILDWFPDSSKTNEKKPK